MFIRYKKVVFLCILACVIILVSCDGTGSGNYIKTEDYLEGTDELKIDIKLEKLYGGSKFKFLDAISINELAEYIKDYDKDEFSLHTSIHQDEYILIKKVDEDKNFLNYYMLQVKGMKTLFCPIATLNNGDSDFDIYMPYHLLVDVDPQITKRTNIYFNIDESFKTVGTRDDFYSFYNTYDRYNVETLDEKLVVRDKVENLSFSISLNELDTYVKYEMINYESFVHTTYFLFKILTCCFIGI